MRSAVLIAVGGATFTHGLAVRSGCQFHLTAGGAITGIVGEIQSGQARVGKDITVPETFTLQDEQIWDSQGRGCWWTPPTYTLQCDVGQTPDKGFQVACDGTVSYQGATTFYECDVDGDHNLYLHDGQGVNCKTVTFKSDGCHADCPTSSAAPPPPPPPTTTAKPPPATTTVAPPPPPSSSGCGYDFTPGTDEYPHYIAYFDSTKPDTPVGGSQLNGTLNGHLSDVFVFDIPASRNGATCSLVFLFPDHDDLAPTTNFNFHPGSGGGQFEFTQLDDAVDADTTPSDKPGVKHDFGVTTLAPGNDYTIATFPCPGGSKIAFEVSSKDGTEFDYFQDYNAPALGLYITVC